jgi:hypothetical protein
MFQNLKFYREVGLFDLISPPIHEDGRWDSAFLEQCFQQRLTSGVRFLGLDLNGVLDFPVATLRLLREVQQQVRPERGHVVVLGANDVCSKILEPLKETAGLLLFQREEELIAWSFQNPEGQAFGTDIVQELALETPESNLVEATNTSDRSDSGIPSQTELGAVLLSEPFTGNPLQQGASVDLIENEPERIFEQSIEAPIDAPQSEKSSMELPPQKTHTASNPIQPEIPIVEDQPSHEDTKMAPELNKPSSAPWGEEKESSPLLWILLLLAIALGIGAYFL